MGRGPHACAREAAASTESSTAVNNNDAEDVGLACNSILHAAHGRSEHTDDALPTQTPHLGGGGEGGEGCSEPDSMLPGSAAPRSRAG